MRVIDNNNDTPQDDDRTFTDVDYTNPLAPFVERLFDLNITRGCKPSPPRKFCPGLDIPRDHMASFTVRAFSPPPKRGHTPPTVIDIAGTTHQHNIEALLAADIIDLCVLRLSSTRRWCCELNLLWQALGRT